MDFLERSIETYIKRGDNYNKVWVYIIDVEFKFKSHSLKNKLKHKLVTFIYKIRYVHIKWVDFISINNQGLKNIFLKSFLIYI